ncbi:hypothetical protein [Mycobacterium sp.]|uniref:hypothetical protein n=1 Tax=Mycobacterium sp. TaxID=1785 RepID=UPI003D0AAD45
MHTDSGYVAVDEAGRPALHPGRANPEWRKITTAAKVHQFAGTMPAIPAVPQCISAVF